MHWSVGLRAKLLPEQVELSDQQIVERPDDERAVLLAELSTDDWKAVRVAKMQAALLDAAESDPRLISVVIDQSRAVAGNGVGGMRVSAPADAMTASDRLVPDVCVSSPSLSVLPEGDIWQGGLTLAHIFRIRV